jgi:phage terminase large subunit
VTWRTLAACLLAVLVSSDAVLAAAKIARYRELPNGPLQFADEQFNSALDPLVLDRFQEQTLVAYGDPAIPRISLQAAVGVGKTAIECMCAWYFLSTQCLMPGHHPKGIAVGVTRENLRDNFWAEMDKWRQRSPYLSAAFTWNQDRIFANEFASTWFLAHRAWPKTGNADQQGATLSGLHGKSVAVFVDESGIIPTPVLRAADQALADKPWFGKILQSGNPISLEGMLYAAAGPLRAQWLVIIVTNDPDDPNCSSRGDKTWAREQIQTYGRDNPWVMSYILGKFPRESLNTLLGIEDVEAAMNRELVPDQYDWAQKRLGVDVARFGDDRTVIAPRQGLAWFMPVIMRGARTTDIAARVYQAKAKWGSELELVDDTGHWGHGVIDNLIAAGTSPHAVMFHAPGLNKRYKNRRAEMWLEMAKAIKGGAALPRAVPDLVGELTHVKYTFVNGVFMLEDKEITKKILGRSPDVADAFGCTYAVPDMPGGLLQRLQERSGGQVADMDYDPERDA